LTPGIYNLCVADGNLCIQCTDAVVSFFNSVDEPGDEKNLLSVYPNPFAGETTLSFYNSTSNDIENIEFEVFDMYGRIVDDFSVSKVNRSGNIFKLNITADNAAPGIYVFKIVHGSDSVVTGKFIVQH